MSASWRDEDEEFKIGGVRTGLKSKPRFSFTEVKMLLEAVKRNRYIILKKFNQGVSAEAKKQTWAEITNQINGLGENHREVRQIMKKWADLKCDGKRRIIALRGPNGKNLRKKHLGPVERMVHKILMMSPRGDGDSDTEFGEDEDFSQPYVKGPPANPASLPYINLTDSSFSLDFSPPSSPEKDPGGDPFQSTSDFDLELADDGEHTMDFDDNEDSMFSSSYPDQPPVSLPALESAADDTVPRVKPVHTYSRNNSQNHSSSSSKPLSGPSSSSSAVPPAPDTDAAASSATPSPSGSPKTSNGVAPSIPPASSVPPSSTAVAAASASPPGPSTSSTTASLAPLVTVSSSSVALPVNSAPSPSISLSNSHQPSPPSCSSSVRPRSHPPTMASKTSDPLPVGASSSRARDHVAQVASQSLQQQQASRMLLTTVSQSLETLAQSVQQLVETQQEFVQESLLLQRETVNILRDFSNTALTMLRDKGNSGQLSAHRHHTTTRY